MRQRQQCGLAAKSNVLELEQHVHTYASSLLFSPLSVNESFLLLLLLLILYADSHFIPFRFVADVNFFCRWIIMVGESWVRVEIQFCFWGMQILDAYAYHHLNLSPCNRHFEIVKYFIYTVDDCFKFQSTCATFKLNSAFFTRWSMAFKLIYTNCKFLFFMIQLNQLNFTDWVSNWTFNCYKVYWRWSHSPFAGISHFSMQQNISKLTFNCFRLTN